MHPRETMHSESKQETRAKFKIRDFLKVPTPKKIFSGKLRPRVTLNIYARAIYEIMCMRKQASIVSKHQQTDIQKQKLLPDDCLYGMKLGVATKTF